MRVPTRGKVYTRPWDYETRGKDTMAPLQRAARTITIPGTTANPLHDQ